MAERSDIAEIKLLESGKKIGQLLAKLRQSYLSCDEMKEILTVICTRPSVINTWLSALDGISTNGIRQELKFADEEPDSGDNRTGSMWIGMRDYIENYVDDTNDQEPWLLYPLRSTYKSLVSEEWCMKVNSLDPLTQVGAIAFEDDANYADQWEAISDRVWTEWAQTKGNNAILKGGVKRGKTNFALLLAEKFMAIGWVVVSNIRVREPPENYRYAADLSSMLKVICEARLKDQNVLIILDEAGLFWAKIDTIQKQNKEMAKLVLTYGKLHANLLTISHYASDIPTIVAKTAIAEFEKTAQKKVFVDIKDGIKLRSRQIINVPATTLQYDPDQIQSFSVNMICQRMYDFMSTIGEGMNQWEMMLEYIEQNKIGPSEDWLDTKIVAQWMKDRGKPVMEIARALDEPQQNISRWTRETPMGGKNKKH